MKIIKKEKSFNFTVDIQIENTHTYQLENGIITHNTSVFNGSSPGKNPALYKFFIRRVRISAHDPLFKFSKDNGVPYHPEVNQEIGTANTYVLEFPSKAPEGTRLSNEFTAIELLEDWKKFKIHYTEHNPSQTIYIKNGEWIQVANWVYNNWDYIGGLSFLPKDDHIYKLAPIEEITEEKYNELISKFPKLDYSKLCLYEEDDNTIDESGCSSGICEINRDIINKFN